MPALFARQDAAAPASNDDIWDGFALWHYTPSMAAGVIFVIVFALLTAYHSFLLIRRRTWFCIPVVIGGLFEMVGYIGRILAVDDTEGVPPYTIQALGLLLAPILFAASVYMVLGRIMRVTQGEGYSIVRVNWLTKIFVTGDVICFGLQAAGGGMLAGANSQADIDRDNNIVLGGLVLQIVIFALFLVTAILFHQRLNRQPTAASLDGPLGDQSTVVAGRFGRMTWRKLMLGLYVCSVLISIRNIFRVVEYAMGWDGYLLSTEWPIYIFDAIPMVLVMIVCVIWYHREISKGNAKRALGESHSLESGDGMISGQREKPMKKQKSRPWSRNKH